MSEISVFAFDSAAVRVIMRDGEPWFVAADVCDALGLGDTSKTCERLDDDEKLTRTIFVSGQNREILIINESGLYSLILTSRKPEAKKFKKWVTSEVLPTIRKTGSYQDPAAQRVQQPASYPQLSHSADIMVNADRTFRAGMRSGRLLGLSTAQTIRRANQIALERTGVDLLEELRANGHVEDMEAAEQKSIFGWRRPAAASVVEFVEDWKLLRLTGQTGAVLPFCPCLGSSLHRAYQYWCQERGMQVLRTQELIGYCSKLPGWRAGDAASTWEGLNDHTIKTRKMVVPSPQDMAQALKHCQSGQQRQLQSDRFTSRAQWYTAGYFAFETALGSVEMAA